MTQVLTHSRLAAFRACPRRAYISYELGIKRIRKDHSARVGSAFAAAVEARAKGLDDVAAVEAMLKDPYEEALVAAMFLTHEEWWSLNPVEHVASELAFQHPILNPSTGRPTPTYDLSGVIDRIVRLPDGQLALMEYKTTSKDFSPASDYWTRLHWDLQLSIYVVAARELGYDIRTILYDVTRRPDLKPKLATPPEKRRYTKRPSKLRDGTERPVGSLASTQRDTDETPMEYAERVAAYMRARPDDCFARIEIARTDKDLEDSKHEIWQQQKAYREAQLAGRFYRNPEACFGNGYRCEYVPICPLHDLESRTPRGYSRETEVNPELARHATSGGHPAQVPPASSGLLWGS